MRTRNAVCLAVFAAQEIEMQVPNDTLPCPSKLGKLFKLGLVSETRRRPIWPIPQLRLPRTWLGRFDPCGSALRTGC